MKLILTLFIFTIHLTNSIAQTTSMDSKLIIDSIQSNCLNESRRFSVYLPEKFDSKITYPIIYSTDGQMFSEDNYKTILDSLISNKLIQPLIFIGLYSNEAEVSKGIGLRQYEYIKDFSIHDSIAQQKYRNHDCFFMKEIRDSICRKYEINVDSKNTTFYGCSNGGGYGVTLFLQNNDSFKQYICFSPLGNIKVSKRKLDNNLKLYIAYGEQENFILIDKYQILIKGLNKNKYNFENTIYNGGHERKAWKNQFTLNVSELFRL